MKIVRPVLIVSHSIEGEYPVGIFVGKMLKEIDCNTIVKLNDNLDDRSLATQQAFEILEKYKDEEYILMTKDELKSVLNIIDDLRLLEGIAGAPALDSKQIEFINKMKELIE